jgi:two-component SAPR family response regulator
MALLQRSADFLATTLGLAAEHGEQATALAALSDRTAEAASEAADLSRALGAATVQPPGALRVFALGPLRAEREGSLITRWGGEKAGSRQAEALFAFLFDRSERGVAKDEILELVWPDIDFDRADLAFHRTLGGLRSTLEPGRRAHDRGDAVVFHHDRYRLNPGIITSSDVDDLDAELQAARDGQDADQEIAHLERARSLFRGEYLDDCPFYGDSAYVEDRRRVLNGLRVDLLLTLGERYEQRGDRTTAATCFRQASQVAGESLPTADAALRRLGSAI